MLSNEEQETLKRYNEYRTGIIPELIEKSLSTIEELKKENERQAELANAFHQMANKYLYKNDELKEEVERYRTALERILKTPQGEWEATTGEGHAECLQIARIALFSTHA